MQLKFKRRCAFPGKSRPKALLRYGFKFLGCIVGIILFSGCLTDGFEGKPNIIIIYADDVGYGDLSSYGAEKIQTVNIDRLADEGIRFTNAYATSAMCTPSRYSLLTGRYAFRHESAGILSAEDPLIMDPDQLSLPSMLKKADYTTAIIGKWHLGLGREGEPIDWNGHIAPGPMEVGFDKSFILPVTNDRVPTVFVDGHQVHQHNPNDDLIQVKYPVEGGHAYQEEQFGSDSESTSQVPQPLVGNLPSGHTHPEDLRYQADDQHSGTIINDVSRIGYMAGGQSSWWDDETIAAQFVKRTKEFVKNNVDRPFFLYLAMHENHVPRIPNSRFVGSSDTGLRGDSVMELDWVVGEVLTAVEELGLRNKTMIIFSSDNGPVFFDGYKDGSIEDHKGHDPSGIYSGGKYTAYEGGTRMPTIISWPAEIEKGIESDALISQVDFLASLAALLNFEIPNEDLDSKNVLRALLGKSPKGRDYVVQQSSDGLALRKGSWKFIEAGDRSEWAYNRHNIAETPLNVTPLTSQEYLFNLVEDPQEAKNLADEYPEKRRELRTLLEKIKNQKIDE